MSGTSIMPASGNVQPRARQVTRRGDEIDPFQALRHEMDRVFDDLGIDEQGVEVSLVGDILTISGETRLEQEEKDRQYRIVERARGSFSRSLRLPFPVDPAKVQATVKDGVLTITVPKPREVREKTSRIAVTRQDGPGVDPTPAAADSAEGTPSNAPPASSGGAQQKAAE